MQDIITYHNFSIKDIDDFVDLFKLVYNRDYSEETFRWQYINNPIGGFLCIVARDGAKMVGVSAAPMFKFTNQNNNAISMRVQNVMVSADYRNRGIFKETIKEIMKRFVSLHGGFIYAFPNQNSLHTFLSLGYQYFKINTYLCKILAEDKLSILSNHTYDVSLPVFGKEDEEFITLSLKKYDIYQIRSIEFLNWRYQPQKNKSYSVLRVYNAGKLEGIVIYKFYQDNLDVMDLFVGKEDDKKIQSIISILKQIAIQNNMSGINIWSSEHYLYHKYLLNSDFRLSSMTTNIVVKFVDDLERNKLNFESFYFSYSDSDVY